MSIYRKLAAAREDFHSRKLTKSGRNTFVKFNYFELGDFLVPGMDALKKQGLTPIVSFSEDMATITVFDGEGQQIVITSPIAPAEVKGAQPVQQLGAMQTYMRRYMWTLLLEIIEHEAVDTQRPLVNQALLDKATSVAKEGRSALREWWKTLSVKDRKALESEVESLQAIAGAE